MNKSFLATLAGLLGYSIFGFSFIFSKVALEVAEPFTLLSIRFIAAFLVLNILWLSGKVKINLKGKPVGILLILGLIQPVLYFICESYGIALTTASFSGVMIGLVPVAGIICSYIFLKEKCTLFQVACTVISVIGVALTTTGGFGSFSLPGFLLLLGAVITGALFTVLSRGIADRFSAFERTYVMFALGSVIFSVIAFIQNKGDFSSWSTPLSTPSFWISVLYLSVISSVCAFMLINFSLSYLSVGRTVIFANFTSAISVVAGIFILHDSFTPIQLLGVVIIIFSVTGASYQKRK